MMKLMPYGVLLTAGTSTEVITADSWAPVITELTKQFSVSTIVSVLAVVIASCVGLAFMWWGVKYALRAIMKAFKKGKLPVE